MMGVFVVARSMELLASERHDIVSWVLGMGGDISQGWFHFIITCANVAQVSTTKQYAVMGLPNIKFYFSTFNYFRLLNYSWFKKNWKPTDLFFLNIIKIFLVWELGSNSHWVVCHKSGSCNNAIMRKLLYILVFQVRSWDCVFKKFFTFP